MRHSISDEPDFISLYFPLALLATTTLVEPERLCFLRTYMVQRMHYFACATQNRPIILRNSLIIIVRHLMANKSYKVRMISCHEMMVSWLEMTILYKISGQPCGWWLSAYWDGACASFAATLPSIVLPGDGSQLFCICFSTSSNVSLRSRSRK